jgi:hypothetical protein
VTLTLGALAVVGWAMYLYARNDAWQWRVLCERLREDRKKK